MTRTTPASPDETTLMDGSLFREIAGISEAQLRYYRENGVLQPLGPSEPGGNLHYAIDQVPIGQLANALRHNDVSVADIAKVVAEGEETLINRTRLQCAEEIRAIRRRLKAVTNLENAHRSFRPVANKKGLYLRYLPVRRLALIPLDGAEVAIPTYDALLSAHRDLNRIATIVGWSIGLSYGTLLSLSADLSRASRFAYIELASPPMPAIAGSRLVDGGCYNSLAPKDEQLSCHGNRCPLCARFGCFPEPGERQAWRATDRREPWRRAGTVLFDDLEEPYGDGVWKTVTEEALGLPAKSDRGPLPPSVPRKMPHRFSLPLGVTACELPAGSYLCRQFSAEPGTEFVRASDTAFSALLATLKQLPLADVPPVAFKNHTPHEPHSAEVGPYVEPFAAPRVIGDTQLLGSYASLSMADISQVGLPLGTALQPENGFCILGTVRPLSTDHHHLVREFQIFTAPSEALIAKLRR